MWSKRRVDESTCYRCVQGFLFLSVLKMDGPEISARQLTGNTLFRSRLACESGFSFYSSGLPGRGDFGVAHFVIIYGQASSLNKSSGAISLRKISVYAGRHPIRRVGKRSFLQMPDNDQPGSGSRISALCWSHQSCSVSSWRVKSILFFIRLKPE